MIVKNEEAYLADCLKSAKPFVDEIIVVDTGSIDRTVEIAKQFGARVFHFAWCDDFAAARNESLRHAQADWILVMDADERITLGSGKLMRRLINAPDVVAYIVKLLLPKEGDGGMMRLGWLPRLFRNRIGARYEGTIHEQLMPSLKGKGPIPLSEITLDHRGYLTSSDEMCAKAQRNLLLLERQVREHPGDGMAWFHLAETYNSLGRLDEAIGAYREALHSLAQGTSNIPDPFLAVAYQNLGVALITQEKTDEGIVAIQRALELVPNLASAHLQLGLAYYWNVELPAAVDHLKKAIELADLPCSPSRPFRINPWLAWFYLGSAQVEREEFDAALESFRQTVRLRPDLKEAHWLLGLTALKRGLTAEALEALEAVRRLGGDEVRLDINIGSARGALGDLDGAVREFQRALAKDSDCEEARFQVCRAYRGLARWKELLKEGTALLEVGAEDPELYRLLGEACMALEAWPEAVLMFESLLAMSDDPYATEQLARCRSVMSEACHG
jgi:tetratricopeptide (TPR) repeat protein